LLSPPLFHEFQKILSPQKFGPEIAAGFGYKIYWFLDMDIGFGYEHFWVLGLGMNIFGYWVWVYIPNPHPKPKNLWV